MASAAARFVAMRLLGWREGRCTDSKCAASYLSDPTSTWLIGGLCPRCLMGERFYANGSVFKPEHFIFDDDA